MSHGIAPSLSNFMDVLFFRWLQIKYMIPYVKEILTVKAGCRVDVRIAYDSAFLQREAIRGFLEIKIPVMTDLSVWS